MHIRPPPKPAPTYRVHNGDLVWVEHEVVAMNLVRPVERTFVTPITLHRRLVVANLVANILETSASGRRSISLQRNGQRQPLWLVLDLARCRNRVTLWNLASKTNGRLKRLFTHLSFKFFWTTSPTLPVVQMASRENVTQIRAGCEYDNDAKQHVVGHLVAAHFADLLQDSIEIHVTSLGLCSHFDSDWITGCWLILMGDRRRY